MIKIGNTEREEAVRWRKEDGWLDDLEKALNSTYPKELAYTLDALKRGKQVGKTQKGV